MNEQYSVISKYYELLNSEVDYPAMADFLSKAIKKYQKYDTELVLDLACGTGALTRELAKIGYDMTGIDISYDMLSVANENRIKDGQDVLYLCQDMREFELYGTVDAVVCCLDSINYLLDIEDVKKCFAHVHNYLVPDGIFIFDINTPKRFKNGYDGRDYIIEEDGILLAWQNYFDDESGICDFVLSLFSEDKDGRYIRYDEEQSEKMYQRDEIEKCICDTGFKLLGVFADYNYTPADEENNRWYFVCRCQKNVY